MKSTGLIRKLLAATLLAGTAFSASAQTKTALELVTGQDFYLTCVFNGPDGITALSNLVGSIFASPSFNTGLGSKIALQAVTFTTVTFIRNDGSHDPSVGSIDLDNSLTGFSFRDIGPRTAQEHNSAGGNYFVKVGGYLSGPSPLPGVALIGINYTVTPVPEPESFAMLLAGLGLLRAVSLRRRSCAKVSLAGFQLAK